MTSSARGTVRRSSQATKASPGRKAAAKSAAAKPARKTRRSATDRATDRAIATDLAPAVAIALLDKSGQSPGDPAPALECLVAGAGPSENADNIRVQLMFENGAVLPVEMSKAAGAALSKGLADELPETEK